MNIVGLLLLSVNFHSYAAQTVLTFVLGWHHCRSTPLLADTLCTRQQVCDHFGQPAQYDTSFVSTCCKAGAPALQEICSFLKGSSEALESPSGKLTLEAYLEVCHQSLSPCAELLYTQLHSLQMPLFCSMLYSLADQ